MTTTTNVYILCASKNFKIRAVQLNLNLNLIHEPINVHTFYEQIKNKNLFSYREDFSYKYF